MFTKTLFAVKFPLDALKIGTADSCVTYDLEPYEVANSPEQCKNGGFNDVKMADGTSFKNQGECVSYVNKNKNK